MRLKTCNQDAEIKLSKMKTHNFDTSFLKQTAKLEMEQCSSEVTIIGDQLIKKKTKTKKQTLKLLIICFPTYLSFTYAIRDLPKTKSAKCLLRKKYCHH